MKIHLSIACLLLTSACLSGDFNVPADAVIACDADADCPEAYRCSEALARCIQQNDDMVPPAFVAGSLSATPLVASVGVDIVVEFETTELLAAIPVVTLSAPALAFTLTGGQPPEYQFTYTVDGNEAEGAVDIQIELIDRVGNEATLGGGTVTLDFTPPALATSNVAPATATDDQTVTAQFTVSEALSKVPDVWLMTSSPRRFTHDNTQAEYTFTLTVTSDVPRGLVDVRADLTDVGGNTSEEVIGSVTIN